MTPARFCRAQFPLPCWPCWCSSSLTDWTASSSRKVCGSNNELGGELAARLVSVNVGLPRDITWFGKTVHTGIWKRPVPGRVIVRKLNIDGDGQGDLSGHGGLNRAVMVYQLDSYRYWERELSRTDFSYGQFGENFTVDGLPDVEVR